MAVRRVPLWGKIAIGAALVVAVLIGVAVALAPGIIKGVVQKDASAKLKRAVVIQGPVRVDWGLPPRITLTGLTVANPPWAKGPMIAIRKTRLRIELLPLLHGRLVLPSLTLIRPRIRLIKLSAKRVNWVFPHPKKPAKPAKPAPTPTIGRLVIRHGLITVRDDPSRTHLAMTITSAHPPTRLRLAGHGLYKGSPFTLSGALGSPVRAENLHVPYPVALAVHIGRFLARIDGTLSGPVALKHVNLHVLLKGAGLGRVNKAVNLPLPSTGRFRLSGQLTRHGKIWSLSHFHGLVGKSDLEGTIHVRPGHPIVLAANLVSHSLNFKDLAGFVKAKPKTVNGHVVVKPHAHSARKVLPAKPYKRSHLLNLDADVIYHAEHVYASHMRIQDLSTHLTIHRGIVRLDPLNFGVANGLVRADYTMNATRPVYETRLRAIARGIHLRLLFPKVKFHSASTGTVGGRLALAAPGNSIAAMMGHATGHLGLALARGSVSNLYVALAQLHVGSAGLDWLSGLKREPIPCAVVRLGMRAGLARTRTFLIDTPSANILARGTVNMRSQAMRMTVYTKPKHVTIFSMRGPLHIAGTLKKPTFSVGKKALIERGAAAVILGAALTPAAALLPLVDTAPGRRVDCPALLNKAGPKARAQALKGIAKRTRG